MSPRDYIQRLLANNESQAWEDIAFPQKPATINTHLVCFETEMKETMMMGLRLTWEGISTQAFQNLSGAPISELFNSEIKELVESGLLEWIPPNNDNLRLTPQDRLLRNQLFLCLV